MPKDEIFRLQGKIIARTKVITKFNQKFLVLESTFFTLFNAKELRTFIDWLILQMCEME